MVVACASSSCHFGVGAFAAVGVGDSDVAAANYCRPFSCTFLLLLLLLRHQKM